MTEYEYIDAMVSLIDSVGFHAMNYISILFAYLIAGYFAGHTLSRFQVLAVTAFYIILCPMPGITGYTTIKEYSRLALEYQSKFRPEEAIPYFVQYGADAWSIVFPGTLLLSIVFMLQSRISRSAHVPSA